MSRRQRLPPPLPWMLWLLASLQPLLPVHAAPPANVDALTRQLADADLLVREQAVARLGALGPQAMPAMAPLMAALADDDPYLRGAAAVALGQIAAPAVPALTQALRSPDARLRSAAAIALGRMGKAALPAMPALLPLLADADAAVRRLAATTLGGLGAAAQSAAPALTRLLSDADEDVRRSAVLALDQVAPGHRAGWQDQATVVAALDRLVPALMAEHQVPGVAVALLRDGQRVWSRGYGVLRAGSDTPVTPGTVFEAASMSKPVLAMLAMQLVDAGQLDLDRPVAAYGPDLPVPDVPDKRLVTARMLLSHTAGYPNWRPGGEEVEGPLPLLFRPGSRFGYSGEGIFDLQRRIAWITGQPLEALAQARLFGPLGLEHTGFGWTPQLGARQASGHGRDGRPRPPSRYRHPNAAYTLYTTVDDYARLVGEMLKAGRGDSALLSQAAAQAMLRPQVAVDAREPIERPGTAQGQAVSWGLGWSINHTGQGAIAHHSGANSTGFRSFVQFSPARGSGLVILTNGMQGDDLWRRLVAAIGDW